MGLIVCEAVLKIQTAITVQSQPSRFLDIQTATTQPSFEDGHNTNTTGESCNAFDDIDDLDLDINQNELDGILQNDIKFVNITLHEANENELSLSVEEITYRLSKVPEHKLRCDINTSHSIEEEAHVLIQNDNKGDTKYLKYARSIATKFFSVLTASTDPYVHKHTQIVNNCYDHETFYFLECFKVAPDNNKNNNEMIFIHQMTLMNKMFEKI